MSSYLRGAGAEDAEGLANEVFLRVFTRMVDFQGGEGKFRSWVFTIAHHLLVDDQRRQRRRGRVVTLDEMPLSRQLDGADPADDVLDGLGNDRVAALLAGLAPDQRSVLLLRVVADLSIEETALTLRKSPGAVKALQHRAVASLRRSLSVTEAVSP